MSQPRIKIVRIKILQKRRKKRKSKPKEQENQKRKYKKKILSIIIETLVYRELNLIHQYTNCTQISHVTIIFTAGTVCYLFQISKYYYY